MVKTADCMPLRELERTFYDPSHYRYLRNIIEKEGLKPAYPVRAFFSDKKQKYEVFDGIHRTKIAQDLGISQIPLIDETGLLTRQEAIAEGIKANKTHAPYNYIDLARNLQKLGESLSEKRGRDTSKGRPRKYCLDLLAEKTGMSEKSISQYLQLLRLPEDVQTLIGTGKLAFSHALVILRLDKTAYRHMIPKMAQQVVREGMSRRELDRNIENILRKGCIEDTKVCQGCKRAFPKENMVYPCLCPSCLKKMREGEKLEPTRLTADSKSEARQKFLRFNAFVERHYSSKGAPIPEKLRAHSEKLHREWMKLASQDEIGDRLDREGGGD